MPATSGDDPAAAQGWPLTGGVGVLALTDQTVASISSPADGAPEQGGIVRFEQRLEGRHIRLAACCRGQDHRDLPPWPAVAHVNLVLGLNLGVGVAGADEVGRLGTQFGQRIRHARGVEGGKLM